MLSWDQQWDFPCIFIHLSLELVQTNLYAFPGWKTLDEAGTPNDTFSHETDAFVGFGACQYRRVTADDYDAAETPEAVIDVIATALRTQCVQTEVESYNDLLTDGLLTMNSDKTFDISPDNRIVWVF